MISKWFVLGVLLATCYCASAAEEPTPDVKVRYTRFAYRKNKKIIDGLAVRYSIHPMYVLLHSIQIMPDSDKWLTNFLLNSAGHWGWNKQKKANSLERAIYREAAICMFWEQEGAAIDASAPSFLKVIKDDAKKWQELLNGLNFTCIVKVRRHVNQLFSREYDPLTKEIKGYNQKGEHDDRTIFELYIHTGYTIFKAQEAGQDPMTLSVPVNGDYQVFNHLNAWEVRTRLGVDCISRIQNGEWFGLFVLSNGVGIQHEPTIAFRMEGMVCGKSFNLNGGCNFNGLITKAPISLRVDMSPQDYYSELQKFGEVVEIQPPVLRVLLTGK